MVQAGQTNKRLYDNYGWAKWKSTKIESWRTIMVNCLNCVRRPGRGDILYTLFWWYTQYTLLNLLFTHFIHLKQDIFKQAGVISAGGVSTTDTGIAFRKISK